MGHVDKQLVPMLSLAVCSVCLVVPNENVSSMLMAPQDPLTDDSGLPLTVWVAGLNDPASSSNPRMFKHTG